MESTGAALGRLLAFGRAMSPGIPATDTALAALREALGRSGVDYALVGGIAVLHHGYLRTTRDVDVLVEPEVAAELPAILDAAGFERERERRWRHRESGAAVDLLVAGEPIPPRGRGRFPSPAAIGRSPSEGDVVALPELLELKLAAGRHQDLADVVGLLQGLDDGEYLLVEAAVPVAWRQQLFALRADAVEERSGR